MEKSSSLIYSASLHFLLLFIILFWPVNTVLDLEANSYQVSLVVGKVGQSVPVGRTARPQPIPQKTEIPKPESQTKPEAKPVEIAKEDSKPVEQEKPKLEEQIEPPASPESSAALSALAELEQMLQADANADGGSETGLEDAENAGGGVYDVYISQVMLVVRNAWSMPIYNRENYIAQIYVELDMAGNIIDMYVEKSSGRGDFDASALNALDRLKKLPAPPSPDLQSLVLVFNSDQ